MEQSAALFSSSQLASLSVCPSGNKSICTQEVTEHDVQITTKLTERIHTPQMMNPFHSGLSRLTL